MNLLKESILLGIQAIPPFARTATLCQNVQCWNDWAEAQSFPAAASIFNIAALAFYPRFRMQSGVAGPIAQTLGLSFWSAFQSLPVPNTFNVSEVLVPQGVEYFAVAWIQPPDWSLEDGPYPEDMFRVIWGLGL